MVSRGVRGVQGKAVLPTLIGYVTDDVKKRLKIAEAKLLRI
jgi:hypothetical protein